MIKIPTNFAIGSDGAVARIGGYLNDQWVKYVYTSANDNQNYAIMVRTFDTIVDILISPNKPDRIEVDKVMVRVNPKFSDQGQVQKVEIYDSTDVLIGSFTPSGTPRDIMVGIGVIGNTAGFGGKLLSRSAHESVIITANENVAMLAFGVPASNQEIMLSEERPDAPILTVDQVKPHTSTLWYKTQWLATAAIEVTHNGKTYYGYLTMTRDPGNMEKTFTFIYPPEEEDFADWFKQNGPIKYKYKYDDQSIIVTANTTTHMGEGTNVLPITTSISNIRIDYNTTDNDHTILGFPITIDVSSTYRQWSIFWYTHVIGYRTSTIGVNDVLISKTQEIRQRPIAGSFVFRNSNYVPPYASVYINGTYIGRINADLSSGAFYFQLPDKYYAGRNIQYNEFPFK